MLPEKIITALYRKDYPALKRFLTEETINLREERTGRTLLMLAVGIEDGLEMLRFLIDSGADVNLADHKGQHTALHFAAFDLHQEAVRILLQAGADPNAQDAHGWTPMHIVVYEPDPRKLLVLDLVGEGADPDRKDGRNVSPREEARRTSQLDLLHCMGSPKPKRTPAGQGKRTRRGK
jgi:ankyrin repeat protein